MSNVGSVIDDNIYSLNIIFLLKTQKSPIATHHQGFFSPRIKDSETLLSTGRSIQVVWYHPLIIMPDMMILLN